MFGKTCLHPWEYGVAIGLRIQANTAVSPLGQRCAKRSNSAVSWESPWDALPNSFNKTLNYFKKFNNCVLVFIKDTNLKSVTQTLKDYKNKDFYKKGKDKLIRNYGIGAQIIKDLKIKNMTLISKSPKKVIGLDGYGIKITKQEII